LNDEAEEEEEPNDSEDISQVSVENVMIKSTKVKPTIT